MQNEITPIGIRVKDSDVAGKPLVKNTIYQNCMNNADINNYHPQNNINTNASIVVLQIPVIS